VPARLIQQYGSTASAILSVRIQKPGQSETMDHLIPPQRTLPQFQRVHSAGLDISMETVFKNHPLHRTTNYFRPASLILRPGVRISMNSFFSMISEWIPFRLPVLFLCFPFASCALMSESGPQKGKITSDSPEYELITIRNRADLPPPGRVYGQGETPPKIKGSGYTDKVRERDSLRIVITDVTEESPFFTKGGPFSYGPVEVPQDGRVSIPYLGDFQTIDRSLADISTEITEKLKPVSNTAQASVARSGRIANTANVVGEVKSPGPVPLERGKIDSLDLLAASGGPRDSEHLYKYTLRRNGKDYVFDYQGFRQRPFPVEEGDLLTVTTDTSNRFYVMGAINRPTIVPFPVAAPTLADALAASLGLDERRSDPSGVFVFRKGEPDKVYTVDLKDPTAMLLTQRFAIKGEDMIYVTEAPLVRWNRVIQQILPMSQFSQAAYYLDRIGQN
jgi:protein involved in polysaccharide export with SLBB domain